MRPCCRRRPGSVPISHVGAPRPADDGPTDVADEQRDGGDQVQLSGQGLGHRDHPAHARGCREVAVADGRQRHVAEVDVVDRPGLAVWTKNGWSVTALITGYR